MHIEFQPVPPFRHNATTEELVRDIEHYYPNLTGLLKLAVEQLKRAPVRNNEERRCANVQSCPHCGSTFMIPGDE